MINVIMCIANGWDESSVDWNTTIMTLSGAEN